MKARELLRQATCAVLIDGQIVGTAWLVSDEGYLLTAGHVLGTGQPVDEVEVRFVKDEDLPFVQDVSHQATRVEWKYDEEQAIDFAVLKLSVPIERRPLRVLLVKEVEGQFRLCGYGTQLKENALSSSLGIVVGSIYTKHSLSTHLFRLQSSDLGVKGNSGGAVFSDELQAVVAIQTEAAKSRFGPESKALLAMPLYRVAQFWQPLQTLAEVKVDQGTMEHLVTQQQMGSPPSVPPLRSTRHKKRNPFYYDLPTAPADFVGRWGLVHELVSNLSGPTPLSWAVIGGRRFGKSSVLKVIESQLFEQLGDCTRGQRHILPLFMDLMRFGNQTEERVYLGLVQKIYESLDKRPDLAINLSSAGLGPLHDAERLSFYKFENYLKKLAQYFQTHHGPLRLVLLFDEAEAIIRFAWCETFFGQLRSLIGDRDQNHVIKLVLTGSTRVVKMRQDGSPLLNVPELKYLDLFSPSDMQQLMARGGQMPDEVAASVQGQSGGHPFIAQYLLSHLWDSQHGLTEASSEQVEKVVRKMRRHRNNDMRGWWEAIGESGQHAYAALAEHQEWIDEDRLIQKLQIKDVDSGLTALCYHGIVARDESLPPQYRVAGEFFRGWYLRNEKGEAVVNNNEEAQPVPPPEIQEEAIFPAIENPKQIQLPAKADLILLEMFKGYQRVVITHDFSALGYSGSWVIRVHPHTKASQLPVVVKIASRALIKKEWHAYRTCIQDQWLSIAQLRGDPIFLPDDDLAGCSYSLMGGNVFQIKSLREYSLEASVSDVRFVLSERLFQIMKERMLLPSQPRSDVSLRASYDAVLPVNLLIELRSLPASHEQTIITPDKLPSPPPQVGNPVRLSGFIVTKVDLRHNTVTLNVPANQRNAYRLRLKYASQDAMKGITLSEPIPALEGVVKETRRSRFEHELKNALNIEAASQSLGLPNGTVLPNPLLSIPAILRETRHLRFNCIHGDLNLENVLIDPKVRDVRLIDFAEARQDHVLHDFLRLETEVVSKLISVALAEAGLSPDVISPFYEELHAATFGNRDGTCSYPALEKPFAILVAIREAAGEGVYDQNKASQEYYPCLILYLVGALRFKNLDRSAKQTAFWGAATILKLMNPSPDVTPPPKTPPSPSPRRQAPIVEKPISDVESRLGKHIPLLVGIMTLLTMAAIAFYLLPPWIAVWYNNQGAKAYAADDLPSAQAYYEQAIQWNSDDAAAHYNLGNVYEELSDLEHAQQEYQLALEGGLDVAYNNQARLYILSEDYKAAVTLLLRGLNQAEDDDVKYDILKNLGWARLGQERYAEAAPRLQAAIDLKPDRAPAHCLLAQVREAEEKAAQAHQAWNNCLAYANSHNPDEDLWLDMAREYLKGEE